MSKLRWRQFTNGVSVCVSSDADVVGTVVPVANNSYGATMLFGYENRFHTLSAAKAWIEQEFAKNQKEKTVMNQTFLNALENEIPPAKDLALILKHQETALETVRSVISLLKRGDKRVSYDSSAMPEDVAASVAEAFKAKGYSVEDRKGGMGFGPSTVVAVIP